MLDDNNNNSTNTNNDNNNINPQCVANLKAEIHTLQDENMVLYEKIKRMEMGWDQLIKKTTVIESSRSKLEWEMSKARGELLTKTSLLQHSNVVAAGEENRRLNDSYQQKLEELHEIQDEAKAATERYNHSMKAWKEEKRAMAKQREEISRKLDACEDELQAYFNENAKLEKQLKQMTKDFTSISHAHTQVQDILDARETHWQKFVRRLGPKHEAIHDIYKAALTTSFCVVESGGLSPAGVLMVNYIGYWDILRGRNIKQMVAVINCLRDFLTEHFLDQDSVLYLLACTSLVVYSLQATYGKDLDEQVLVRLEDYHLLENIGLKTTLESYCGSGYSSDSSDCNTEGTAGYTSDSASGESSYATDSNESSTESPQGSPLPPPAKRSAARGKSVINLRAPAGMLNLVKPLLFKRHTRRDMKPSSKPPLMSDTYASSTDANFSETSSRSTTPTVEPRGWASRIRGGNSDKPDSGYSTPHGTESGYSSPHGLSDSGYVTPRGMKDSGGVARRGRSRRNDTWEVMIRDDNEFFAELNFMFAMTITALIKKVYKRLDEILDFARIEENFAHFCAFRAGDPIGQPPARIVLGELTDVLNALVSAFEVHMLYFSLAQKIFEEIFGRLSKMLANIVISRNHIRSETFGSFLMVVWERLEALCKGNEWTGSANRQLSLVKQCAMLLSLKDKSLVENSRKREATFPDLNENQIRHIMMPEIHHRPHSHTQPTPSFSPRGGGGAQQHAHGNVTAKVLLFSDLDYVRPFAIRIAHYLRLDELQKLPVPPFLVETLGVV